MRRGLPVGMQLIGSLFDEAMLLRTVPHSSAQPISTSGRRNSNDMMEYPLVAVSAFYLPSPGSAQRSTSAAPTIRLG